jgi:hypothetical protein
VLLDHRQQQYKYHQQDANISTSTAEVRHKNNEIYYIDITLRLRNTIAVDGVGRWIDHEIPSTRIARCNRPTDNQASYFYQGLHKNGRWPARFQSKEDDAFFAYDPFVDSNCHDYARAFYDVGLQQTPGQSEFIGTQIRDRTKRCVRGWR